MQFYPLKAKVLVKPIEPSKETESGLVLVYEAGPPVTGTVVAIGPDVGEDELAVGHTVLFSPYVGQDVNVNDTRYLLLEFADISAVVTADAAETCPTCGRVMESNVVHAA